MGRLRFKLVNAPSAAHIFGCYCTAEGDKACKCRDLIQHVLNASRPCTVTAHWSTFLHLARAQPASHQPWSGSIPSGVNAVHLSNGPHRRQRLTCSVPQSVHYAAAVSPVVPDSVLLCSYCVTCGTRAPNCGTERGHPHHPCVSDPHASDHRGRQLVSPAQ